MTDNKVGCNGRPPKAMYRIMQWLEFEFIAEHLKRVKSFAGCIVLLVLKKKKRKKRRSMISFHPVQTADLICKGKNNKRLISTTIQKSTFPSATSLDTQHQCSDKHGII